MENETFLKLWIDFKDQYIIRLYLDAAENGFEVDRDGDKFNILNEIQGYVFELIKR